MAKSQQRREENKKQLSIEQWAKHESNIIYQFWVWFLVACRCLALPPLTSNINQLNLILLRIAYIGFCCVVAFVCWPMTDFGRRKKHKLFSCVHTRKIHRKLNGMDGSNAGGWGMRARHIFRSQYNCVYGAWSTVDGQCSGYVPFNWKAVHFFGSLNANSGPFVDGPNVNFIYIKRRMR